MDKLCFMKTTLWQAGWQLPIPEVRDSSCTRAGDVHLEAFNIRLSCSQTEYHPSQNTLWASACLVTFCLPSVCQNPIQGLGQKSPPTTKIKLLPCPLWHSVNTGYRDRASFILCPNTWRGAYSRCSFSVYETNLENRLRILFGQRWVCPFLPCSLSWEYTFCPALSCFLTDGKIHTPPSKDKKREMTSIWSASALTASPKGSWNGNHTLTTTTKNPNPGRGHSPMFRAGLWAPAAFFVVRTIRSLVPLREFWLVATEWVETQPARLWAAFNSCVKWMPMRRPTLCQAPSSTKRQHDLCPQRRIRN